MSAAGIEGIDHTVHQTNIWIKELDARLGWDSRQRSYRVLRVVLQALRDWMPINEGANLSAQLPTLLRGVFYDQWHPASVPTKKRDREAFLRRVEEALRPDSPRDPEIAVTAVFSLLSDKITAGEVEDLRASLPRDVREMWPAPAPG